jgi:hypothetical protein
MTLKRIKFVALLVLVVALALVMAKAGGGSGHLLGMFDGDG